MTLIRRHMLTGALAAAFLPAAPAIVKAATARRSIDEFYRAKEMRGKSEAAADWTPVFQNAVADGPQTPIYVPPGNYPFRSASKVEGPDNNVWRCVVTDQNEPRSVDIVCDPDARFIVGSQISAKSGALFTFYNINSDTIRNSNIACSFVGGKFHATDLTALDKFGNGFGIFDIYGYAGPYIADVVAEGGFDPSIGRIGADTFMTTHYCVNERIFNVRGAGFFDCFLYFSGGGNYDVVDGDGQSGYVKGGGAARCGNGIAVKRNYVGLKVENYTIENCTNGIIGSSTNSDKNDQGTRTQIIGGRISNISGRPIVIFGRDPIVENVTIGEFGYDVPNGQTPTVTARGNEIAGIDLRGAIGGRVINNVITTRAIPNDPRSGITVRQDARGTTSRGTKIYGNSISGPARAIYAYPGNVYDSNP